MNLGILGGLVAALFISGCTSMPVQNLNEGIKQGVFYKRDMMIDFDGKEYEGVAVLPKRTYYDIDIKARGKLDLFLFETCHRTIENQEAWTKKKQRFFWGTNKNETRVRYIPNPGMENGPIACPVRLHGYDKQGQHSWGYIDFENDTLTLPAYLRCAGQNEQLEGVGICQSRKGTIQEIAFKNPVFHSSKGDCGALSEQGDSNSFRFEIKKGECIYHFKEDSADGREFRLTTIGYESILIRSE